MEEKMNKIVLPFRSHYEDAEGCFSGFYVDRVREKLCKDGIWREIERVRINRIKSVFENLKWILEH